MIIPGIVAAAANAGSTIETLTYSGNSLDVSSEVSFPSAISINKSSSAYLYVFSNSTSVHITSAGGSLASGVLGTSNWIHTAAYSSLRGLAVGGSTWFVGSDNAGEITSVSRGADLGNTVGITPSSPFNPAITFLSLDIATNGSKLLALSAGGVIYEYSFTTSYDTEDGMTQLDTLDVSSLTSNPVGICCNAAGTRMWVADQNGDVYEYTLGTDRDLSTATLESGVLSQLSELGGNIADICHRFSGNALYVVTVGSDATIYEYNWTAP